MAKDYRSKIDPRLRGYLAVKKRVAAVAERTAGVVQAFIEVADQATRRRLEELSSQPQSLLTNFVHLVDGYCTATILEDRIEQVAEIPGVTEVEAVRHAQPLLHRSVDAIHGWDGIPEGQRLAQGAGVVIGIVDYGLDFWMNDFRAADGSTRVEYLWDQDLEPAAGEKPPAKYGYGVEYSKAQIDAELSEQKPRGTVRHNPLNAEANIRGHGTHVAGIAAGNGASSGSHVGVAPASRLVFVNLPRSTIVDQVSQPLGSLANSINLAHAIAYCFERAASLRMPCVVNLSMGFHGGGHDGNMIVECIIDELLAQQGRAVVIAAGNEHEAYKKVHYGARIKQGAAIEVRWEIGWVDRPGDDGHEFPLGDPTTNEVEIWYANDCRIAVELIAPREAAPFGPVQPDSGSIEHVFEAGEQALIASDQETPWEGAARIYIRLSPGGPNRKIRQGTWIIRLRALEVAAREAEKGVRFDAWIERTIPDPGDTRWHLWSRFADYDRDAAITLTTPGTSHRAITVASCGPGDGTPASEFSSRGPTRDGREKPEIAAPGEWITSSAARQSGEGPNRSRTTKYGTSMSAPHVTGLVARLLSRHNFLRADEIRTLLVNSATPPGRRRAWDRGLGHGKVNAAAAMKALEDKLAQ